MKYSEERRKNMSIGRKKAGTSVLQYKHLEKLHKNNIGKKQSQESIEKRRTAMKGFKVSEETKRKISIANKGHTGWPKGKKRPESTRIKLSETRKRLFREGKITSPFQLEKKGYWKGEKHWNWKGGINPINDSLRKSTEMKLVKKACLERDNFTCQECNQIGGKLHAHHIKPFSIFPELRFALDNLTTLCETCHMKTPTYAGRVLSYQSS